MSTLVVLHSRLQAVMSSPLQDAVRGDFNDLAKLLIDRGAMVVEGDRVSCLHCCRHLDWMIASVRS
jgi:hypothetical protein